MHQLPTEGIFFITSHNPNDFIPLLSAFLFFKCIYFRGKFAIVFALFQTGQCAVLPTELEGVHISGFALCVLMLHEQNHPDSFFFLMLHSVCICVE